MKAVILAGGEGTRLRPLTCNLPKPLVPVCTKPVLEYILDLLAEHGCTEAVIALRYKGEKIERHFSSGTYKGITLGFSTENSPLGTAGCVKIAAANFDEDFVVISGDAMCDIDLSAALEFHRKNGADATIITKRVDDPREYGLIIEEKGSVTDFSEKPSYINCRSDRANTGIYVISPRVLGLIPDGEMWDFAKNVFPDMLNNKMKLMCCESEGYWCDIGDIPAYKRCCADMLGGKIKAKLPENLRRDKNLLISRTAQISKSALITGESVIGNSVCICDGAKLRNAIVMDGAFIGENVTLNDCIICTNAHIESGAAVYENAVVGENAEVGENAVICGGIRVWQDKNVEKGAFVNSDMKYGAKTAVDITEDGINGETNTVITPEFAGRLGCAVSKISDSYIAVSCSEENASETLKNALLSGISSTGRQCFDCGNATVPMLSYSAALLNCDIIVHISARTRTRMLVYGTGVLPLTRAQERMLENALNRGEYLSASWNNFSSINKFTGAASLYSAMLEGLSDFTVPYRITLNCLNTAAVSMYSPFFGKIGTGRAELIVNMNEKTTKAEILTENGKRCDYGTLILLAAVRLLAAGEDVALPFAFLSAADYVAERYGRKIHRFYASAMDDSDRFARKLAAKQMFLYDGFVLVASVLKYLSENGQTLDEAISALPKFTAKNRFVHISCPPQKILSKIENGRHAEKEGVLISEDGERVFLRSNKRGDGLYLFAESFNSETAAQLCEKTEDMIRKIMKSLN